MAKKHKQQQAPAPEDVLPEEELPPEADEPEASQSDERSEPDPEPKPQEKFRSAGRLKLVLKRDLALGNGHRQRGECLCVVEFAKGVTPREVFDALRNPQHFELQET